MSTKEDGVDKNLKDLAIVGSPDVNILLLGSTGAGKSTFINSLANYIAFSDITQAEDEREVKVLIPSKFSIKDKYGKNHNISVGEEDKNENLQTGQSATQDVKPYIFRIYNNQINVRIIDTPGLQDTRNVGQDAINCENILSYIGQLHELHAICFLFEPNATRNTVVFRYCIDQMLTRLDKSASKNIIFIFTNTRGSDYRPGETIGLLEEIINKLKRNPPYIEIPLKKNIFCFDNECFHYLAARKNKIRFDNASKEDYRKSWKQSSNEFWKLIRYIEGDKVHPPLKPHFVKHTTAINEARRLIVQLAQPLTEIVQLINHNLEALHRHEESLNMDNQTIDQMKDKLYMPVIVLEVTKLTEPSTICANPECAEVVTVAGKNSWHYKQRCHEPCYLKNVPKEIIGTSELKHCASMKDEYCIKCKHCFSIHMHVYYMTKHKLERQKDSNVEKDIHNKEIVLEHKRKLLDKMTSKRAELMEEHNIIIDYSAKFAHFLENNAISPFSDSYVTYFQHLIEREKSLGAKCDVQTICYLETLIEDYEKAKKAYDQALKSNKQSSTPDQVVTAKDIQNGIQELYKLKHNGVKIKELYGCQKKTRQKEHREKEFVFDVQKKNSEDSQDKNKNEKKEKKEKKQKSKNSPDDTQDKNKNENKKETTEKKKKKQQNEQDQLQAKPNTNPPKYQDKPPQYSERADYRSHPGQPDYRSRPGQPGYHLPQPGQYPGPPSYPYYDSYWQQAPNTAPYPDPNQRFDSHRYKNMDTPIDVNVNVQSTEPHPSAQTSFPYSENQHHGAPYSDYPYHGPPHYPPHSDRGHFRPPRGPYPPHNYPYSPDPYHYYNQRADYTRSFSGESHEWDRRNSNRGGYEYRRGRGRGGNYQNPNSYKKKKNKESDSSSDSSDN